MSRRGNGNVIRIVNTCSPAIVNTCPKNKLETVSTYPVLLWSQCSVPDGHWPRVAWPLIDGRVQHVMLVRSANWDALYSHWHASLSASINSRVQWTDPGREDVARGECCKRRPWSFYGHLGLSELSESSEVPNNIYHFLKENETKKKGIKPDRGRRKINLSHRSYRNIRLSHARQGQE